MSIIVLLSIISILVSSIVAYATYQHYIYVSQPKVVAYLRQDKDYPNFLNFCIENFGKEPAKNVKYSFDKTQDELKQYDVAMVFDPDKADISLLAPGQRTEEIFGDDINHPNIFRTDPKLDLLVTIEFEDLNGNKFTEYCRIVPCQFLGIGTLESLKSKDTKNLKVMADSLKTIARYIRQRR